MEYSKNFPLKEALHFLANKGLSKESDEIKASTDKFMSYDTTLKRAKIIALVKENMMLDEFLNTVWPSGLTDKGKTRTSFFANLAIRFYADQEGTISEDEDEIEGDEIAGSMGESPSQFAYESDLRSFLVKNLNIIENGLKLYEGADGTRGEEFYIPGTSRRIDILATDKNNDLVVIELKVSRGYERVVGQTLYYQSMIKRHFLKNSVRAIIVAREISPELKAATQDLPHFELFEYHLSLTLSRTQ